jgi:hypothetical protein
MVAVISRHCRKVALLHVGPPNFRIRVKIHSFQINIYLSIVVIEQFCLARQGAL